MQKPRSHNLDLKGSEHKSEGDARTPYSRFFGDWNYLPIYLFFLFSFLQDRLVALASAYLPIYDLGRHVTFVSAAVFLCPLQFFATVTTIGTTFSRRDETVKSKEDEKLDDPGDGEQSRAPVWAVLVKVVVAMYSWLAPITFFWAVSIELSKEGALRLSRYLSLTQYAESASMRDFSNSDLGLVASKATYVLALYATIWVALVLPATIAMRRLHASSSGLSEFRYLRSFPIDEKIRDKSSQRKNTYLSYPMAWHSLAWKPYRALLVLYASSYFVLSLVGAMNLQLGWMMFRPIFSSCIEDQRNFPDGYLGWWASFWLHIKNGFGKLY